MCSFRFLCWNEVEERVSMWGKLLPGVKLTFDLASEADPLVLERLKERGLDFSVLGAGYLERLKVMGVPPSQISLTAGAPLSDAIRAARVCKPAVLSVGSMSALESLIVQRCVPEGDWDPCLQILVRHGGDQPLLNPAKVDAVIRRAKQAGFSSFGISVLVEDGLGSNDSRQALIRAVKVAAEGFSRELVSVDRLQILGGLLDSNSLATMDVKLDQYLGDLSETVQTLEGVFKKQGAAATPAVSFEGGQLLVGHIPIFSVVTNVKRQRSDGVLEVFLGSHVYADLAGHMFRGTRVKIDVLPAPGQELPLSTKYKAAVMHGATCDSIDSVFEPDGTLQTFFVPEDISGGCILVIQGKRLADGATDFNRIPPAQLVVHDASGHEALYQQSVLADSQVPYDEAAKQLWGSPVGQNLREFFKKTVQQIDGHVPVGGFNLSKLATDATLRTERFQRVAQSFLEQYPDCQGTITFLDLQVYAAMLRNVTRYLKEAIFTKPGESIQQARERMAEKGLTGVDKIFLPLKTLSDPLALVGQAALGLYHDAASAGEMRLSAEVGVSPSDMLVSHPHKTPETLRMVCDPLRSPWGVTIDSREELNRLIKAGLSKEAVVFIRFKAKGANVVANLSAKFGMPVASHQDREKIIDLLEYAQDEGFKKLGWAFHVGTQSANREDYATALKTAYKLTQLAVDRRKSVKVNYFNIGGGICDERVAAINNTTGKAVVAGVGAQVAAFREVIERLLGERVCIVAEPGRVTCAAAGFMMSQVLAGDDAHFTGARIRWATTKQGNLSGNVHDAAFFDIKALREDPGAQMIQYEVHGSSNRRNDTFPSIDPTGRHRLPSTLQTGDWLWTEGGIAYGVNAAGNVDGIDQGQLFAFYIDDEGKTHFIESPWSEPEKLRNRYLAKYLEQHKSCQAESL